MSFRQCRSRVK